MRHGLLEFSKRQRSARSEREIHIYQNTHGEHGSGNAEERSRNSVYDTYVHL